MNLGTTRERLLKKDSLESYSNSFLLPNLYGDCSLFSEIYFLRFNKDSIYG